MATTVILDTAGSIRYSWEGGRIVSAERGALVYEAGGESGDPAGLTLADVQSALEGVGIVEGSQLVVNTSTTLLIDSIDAQQRDDSLRIFDVTIGYKSASDGAGADETPRVTFQSSLEQIETQVDKDGVQIILAHDGVEQGGLLRVTNQRLTIVYPKRVTTTQPIGYAAGYLNRVNSALWNQAEPGKWKCTAVSAEPITSGVSATWDFEFTFELNPDGHQPEVVFIDPETGNPPPNLTQGQGYKSFDWFLEADFGVEFPEISQTGIPQP